MVFQTAFSDKWTLGHAQPSRSNDCGGFGVHRTGSRISPRQAKQVPPPDLSDRLSPINRNGGFGDLSALTRQRRQPCLIGHRSNKARDVTEVVVNGLEVFGFVEQFGQVGR